MNQQNEFTILLQGGLGNQLFGWAAAESLAIKNNGIAQVSKKFLKHGKYELSKYSSEPKVSSGDGIRLTNRTKLFKEKDFHFDERFFQLSESVILKGYFQSWKYFDHCANHIRQTFSTISEPSSKYESLLSQLEREPYTAIHVRRGDYVGLTDYHGLTSREYFTRAIDIIKRYQNTQKVVVFSDDIAAARELLDWGDIYLGTSDLENSVETLDLLSRATNLVGSNSSFSWWGGYLRDDMNGVRIMPRPWFANQKLNDRDLLPPNWMTLGI